MNRPPTLFARSLWVAAAWLVVAAGCAPSIPTKAPPVVALAAAPEAGWPIPETHQVTSSDLSRAEAQVRQMIKDRPGMAELVTESSPLYRWTVRQFAGVRTGGPIDWRSSGPFYAGYEADSQSAMDGQNAYIEVADRVPREPGLGEERSSEDLWASVVFELNNVAHGSEFDRVYQDALMGKVNRDQFLERNTRIEFESIAQSQMIYRHLWAPMPHKVDPGDYWFLWATDYASWIAVYTDRNSYPWDSWGKYFDEIDRYRRQLPSRLGN